MNWASSILIAMLLTTMCCGCAQWKEMPDVEGTLASPKPSPSASIIDIGFVTLPTFEDKVDWQLWNDVDEQVLPDALRQELAGNGLRAGRLVGKLPDLVAAELEPANDQRSLQFLQQADLLSEVAHGGRRIYCRTATRYELPVRTQMRGEVSLLTRRADCIIGHRLIDPLFQFAIETRRGDNGEIVLRLVPEVQHGGLKQSWVSKDQALRLDSRRDVKVLEHLAIEMALQPGQALLISPTATPKGLGEKMLMGQRVDLRQDVVAVVIRLTQEPSSVGRL